MHTLSTSAQRARALLSRIARNHGYAVSGNHVFTLADHRAILAGWHRPSVGETPGRHSPRVVRVAELLARTY